MAKNASLDLVIELPRGVRRGNFDADFDGVFGASVRMVLAFFAERPSSWGGKLFSLSEPSETTSSFRFLPPLREEASLFRTMRIVPVVEGPKLIALSDSNVKTPGVFSVVPLNVRRRDGEAEVDSVFSCIVGYSTELPSVG